MRTVHLDGGQIGCRQDLHRDLARGLTLPEWYGNNLDALADCLTMPMEPTCIRVTGVEALERGLGQGYCRALLRLLARAQSENPALRVEVE